MLGLGVGFYKLAGNEYVSGELPNKAAFYFGGSHYYHSNYTGIVDNYGIYNFGANPNATGYGFSFWMRPDDGRPASSQVVMDYTVNASNNFQLVLQSDGKLAIDTYANGSKGSVTSTSTVFTNGAQSWKHIVITAASESEEENIAFGLRVNNSNVGFGESSLSSSNAINFSTTGTNQYFGANASGGSGYTGYLDEIAFYNTAIGLDHISNLYNSGNGANPTTLSPAPVLCWRGEKDFEDSANGHGPGTNSGVTFEDDPDEIKPLV